MIQGQLLDTTERGQILKKIISHYKPKNIVEIGTWKGLGSTKCIVDSINYDEVNFISIESNYDFYVIAQSNLSNYRDKVNLIYGKIVEKEDLLDFTNNEKLSSEQKKWLQEDIKNIEKCSNIIESIPNVIDFLLLDGGEFSTYPEWIKLKNRVKIVVLDDVRELKTKKIYNELLTDNNYKLIIETNDGNGFSVFEKI